MGGTTFGTPGPNGEADIMKAFDAVVKEAQYESGHGGYTGTIAEKRSYVVVQHQPVTMERAQQLADEMIDRGDVRIDDKWGPAGAIRVADPGDAARKRKPYNGWYFFGWASS